MAITEQIKKAWNAFRAEEEKVPLEKSYSLGVSSSVQPQRVRTRAYTQKSVVTSIYTRIAIDVAGLNIRHSKLDEFGRYSGDVASALNSCFTLEPNIDQGPRQFRQNIVSTLLDSGVSVLVPVDTQKDPTINARFDIYSLRVGEVIDWYTKHVKVRLYNDSTGAHEELILEKRFVAIVENPLYEVMNAPNSTLQRLIRKLQLLDAIDEQSGSGKLDLIIQLPYVIKSETRKKQAEERAKDIEFQLKGSQYGIAYTEGTEKITQLNRPSENNLLAQVEYLTNMLYGELGITPGVMDGSADEKVMLNYHNRTIKPILDAIVESMNRAWLGKLGVQRKEKIMYFADPFALVPISEIAGFADEFSRNEILTANEIRSFMGIQPSVEAKADQLVNSNMPPVGVGGAPVPTESEEET